MSKPCVICGTEAEPLSPSTVQTALHWRCGEFVMNGTVAVTLPPQLNEGGVDRSVLSHLLRLKHENSQAPVPISTYDYPVYQEQKLPNPQEQADNLILWVGANQRQPEAWVEVTRPRLAAIIGCSIGIPQPSEPGLHWLMSAINEQHLYESNPNVSGPQSKLRLTMIGWHQYERLRRVDNRGMSAFMAMSFRVGEIEQIEPVFRDCFKPAAARAGFDLRLVTDGQGAGLIDDQIRVAIRRARFAVVDLTHDNNGAYFEAGFAEGLGMGDP